MTKSLQQKLWQYSGCCNQGEWKRREVDALHTLITGTMLTTRELPWRACYLLSSPSFAGNAAKHRHMPSTGVDVTSRGPKRIVRAAKAIWHEPALQDVLHTIKNERHLQKRPNADDAKLSTWISLPLDRTRRDIVTYLIAKGLPYMLAAKQAGHSCRRKWLHVLLRKPL